MEDSCVREVKELHAFFERWYAGEMPDTNEGFSRMTSAIAGDFRAVGPGANHLGKPEIAMLIRDGHGKHQGSGSDFRIEVRNAAPHGLGRNLCVVTYEEWQLFRGAWSARASSAVFRRRASAPNGFEWVHLHESWLPGYAGA